MQSLRSRRDFERLQAVGRGRSHRLVVVRSAANDVGHDRYGISTGRRIGTAVERNRVRRRIREIVRAEERRGEGDSRDILIVARPGSVTATFTELSSALRRLLRAGRADGLGTGR